MSTQTPPHRAAWRAAVPVVFLAAGLLFAVAAKLAGAGDGAAPPDLAGLIQERNGTVERLTEQAAALQTEVDGLAAKENPQDSTLKQADLLAPEIGLEAVTGPGLQVSLDDAGYTLATLPEGYNVDDVVVHQGDVQAVVNAMWAGGAEAMMIQDQRVVATSSVQCVGNTLYLQGRVYSPPYTITAIGDADGMQAALAADPVVSNYVDWANVLGLGYEVTPLSSVELPAFAGTVRPQHVTVLTDDLARETSNPTDQ